MPEKLEFKENRTSDSEILATKIGRLTLLKKAYNVLTIDIRGLASFTDFFVLCSVDSDKQAKAVSDVVLDNLKQENIKPYKIQLSEPTWILLDFVQVIVHIFTVEKRKFYNLERLWGDGAFNYIEDKELTLKKN